MGFKVNPLPGALSSCPIPIQPKLWGELAVGDQPGPLLARKNSEIILGLVPCLSLLPLWAQRQHKADFLGCRVSNEPSAQSLHRPSQARQNPWPPCQEPRWPRVPKEAQLGTLGLQAAVVSHP